MSFNQGDRSKTRERLRKLYPNENNKNREKSKEEEEASSSPILYMVGKHIARKLEKHHTKILIKRDAYIDRHVSGDVAAHSTLRRDLTITETVRLD